MSNKKLVKFEKPEKNPLSESPSMERLKQDFTDAAMALLRKAVEEGVPLYATPRIEANINGKKVALFIGLQSSNVEKYGRVPVPNWYRWLFKALNGVEMEGYEEKKSSILVANVKNPLDTRH